LSSWFWWQQAAWHKRRQFKMLLVVTFSII
jgi:hypothetical protein